MGISYRETLNKYNSKQYLCYVLLLREYIFSIINEGFNNSHLFIRFGRFARGGGRSRVGLDDEFKNDVLGGKQYESGLSVYFVKPHKDGFMLQGPNRRRAAYGIGHDYFGHMFKNIFMDSINRGDIFLVQGNLIEVPANVEDEMTGEIISTGNKTFEVGSDGEPVIENVRIVKRLKPSEVYIDPYGEKTIEDIYQKQIDDISHDIIEDYLERAFGNEELREYVESMSPNALINLENEFNNKNVILKLFDILDALWDKNKKISPEDFILLCIKLNRKTKNPKDTLNKISNHFKEKWSEWRK